MVCTVPDYSQCMHSFVLLLGYITLFSSNFLRNYNQIFRCKRHVHKCNDKLC